MTTKIYHNPRCSKSRQTLQLLNEKGVDTEIIEYLKTPPDFETLNKILQGDHKKGDVLGIARIAGIMAAKKTADLIPLCHPLALTHVDIDFKPDTQNNCIFASCRVETRGQTGVEMEALTAVSVAALTIYDMCKALSHEMEITSAKLPPLMVREPSLILRSDPQASPKEIYAEVTLVNPLNSFCQGRHLGPGKVVGRFVLVEAAI